MRYSEIPGKFFILSLLVLMPIDYFYPTADVFREAGAKPFNLYVVFGFLVGLVIFQRFSRKIFYHNSNNYLLFILVLGSVSFLFSTLYVNYPTSNRTPEFQFTSQLLMFALFILVFNILRLYFSRDELRQFVVVMIPTAVIFHLVIFSIEFFNLLNASNPGPIIFFRNNAGFIDRASGLMSEPSYFGVFAGLFVVPLFFICKRYRLLNIIMALILIYISVIIQAKTFFIVVFSQILFIFLGAKQSQKTKFFISFLTILLIAVAIYIINTTSVFNVEENLSSAMRLGSSLLALNVASSGYGLLGIGFGQFHFFYLPEYSPNFLFLSNEALDQMNNVNDMRASTFNLPIRILVETGVLGLITLIGFIYGLFKKYSTSIDLATQTGLLFISGSIGFLMTQDSYCLPSFAFGLALVVTQPKNNLDG